MLKPSISWLNQATIIHSVLLSEKLLKKNLKQKNKLGDDYLRKILRTALDDEERKKNKLAVIFVTRDKHPRFKGWEKYADPLQSDEDIINLFNIRYNKNTGYSYFTGIGGLIDLDFDWEWLYNEAEREFGDRFKTRTIRTPSNGYRVLFRTNNPIDYLEYKNRAPRVEIHGKKGHHVVVYGKGLNDDGELKSYELLKDLPIQFDGTIIEDFKAFLQKWDKKCAFLKYKCISSSIKNKHNNLNHDQRTALACFFKAEKIKQEVVIDFFRSTPNFNYEKTSEHIDRIYQKDFKHPTCKKLCQTFHWDENKCSGCERKQGSRDSAVLSDEKDKRGDHTLIADQVISECDLFVDDRNIAYVNFKSKGHYETWPIRSKNFKHWITKLGRVINDNDNIPSQEAINSAIHYLEAVAFDGDKVTLKNRVASYNDHIVYDLTNKDWEFIKISKEGWTISNGQQALFRRHSHQKAQKHPIKGANPWKLFEFINVPKENQLLVLVLLISYFIPDISHPVMILFGPQGSGKSLSMEFIRMIIDPSELTRMSVPRQEKDIMQNFDHHYATFFDNLRPIPAWFSDIICRAVTGEGSEHRALYTDSEPIIRHYRCCVGLNGIDLTSTEPDLLDRSVIIELESIDRIEREEENKLRGKFNETIPEILGGIFDTLVRAINIYPEVKLDSLPRMADFAVWGYAISEALRINGDEFMSLYSQNEIERTAESIDANSIAVAVLAFMKKRSEWEGTPTDLLTELNKVAEELQLNTKIKTWPTNSSWVTRRLNPIVPLLKNVGISFSQSRGNKKRILTLKKLTENGVFDDMVSQPVSMTEN